MKYFDEVVCRICKYRVYMSCLVLEDWGYECVICINEDGVFNFFLLSFIFLFIVFVMKFFSLVKVMVSFFFLDRYFFSIVVWGLFLVFGWCNLYLNFFLVMIGIYRLLGRGIRSLLVRRFINFGCFFRIFIIFVNDCFFVFFKFDIIWFGYVFFVREIKYN